MEQKQVQVRHGYWLSSACAIQKARTRISFFCSICEWMKNGCQKVHQVFHHCEVPESWNQCTSSTQRVMYEKTGYEATTQTNRHCSIQLQMLRKKKVLTNHSCREFRYFTRQNSLNISLEVTYQAVSALQRSKQLSPSRSLDTKCVFAYEHLLYG